MNTILISRILLTIAILAVGVIYGTDMFYAIAGRKAAALSKDSSSAYLVGHTHFVADKRMPFFGIASVVSTALFIIISYMNGTAIWYSGLALVMLLTHLALYLTVAKPINMKMSEAAVKILYRKHPCAATTLGQYNKL
jgi:hypothetical protein